MQLYAKDQEGILCIASLAKKKVNYRCIECSQEVRLRSGFHRQPHFYHLSPNIRCQQHKKSMQHLQVQWKLSHLLPLNDCFLERPFPTIGRIADVVWESRKLVFEIQCSSISLEEVQQRNLDYQSLGYHVIWILHAKTFNQKKMSAAEVFLRRGIAYFTNIDAEGKGEIFDQFEMENMGLRINKLSKLPIEIQSPLPISLMVSSEELPKKLVNRLSMASFHFKGDLYDCFLRRNESEEKRKYYEEMLEFEKMNEVIRDKKSLKWYVEALLHKLVVRPYIIGLHYLLEKASR